MPTSRARPWAFVYDKRVHPPKKPQKPYSVPLVKTPVKMSWMRFALPTLALALLTAACHQTPVPVDGIAGSIPKYELLCSEGACLSSVGLVVAAIPDVEAMRCTAALIAPDRVLTAGHCVDRAAHPSDVWIGFPETADHVEEWVAGDRVLHRSIYEPQKKLLQPDYAVIQLKRPLSRAPLATLALAPSPGDIVRMVSVTPDRFYDHRHHIAVRRCRVESSSFARSTFGPKADDVGWLSRCPIREGNSGAPLLDVRGRLRGLVHGAAPPFFAVGVMTKLDFVL